MLKYDYFRIRRKYLFFGILFAIVFYIRKRKKAKHDYLLKNGKTVTATIDSIKRKNIPFGTKEYPYTVNDKEAWEITASWLDEFTNQTYNFVSDKIWGDPSAYIINNQVNVVFDAKSPSTYMFDLSFLPKKS